MLHFPELIEHLHDCDFHSFSGTSISLGLVAGDLFCSFDFFPPFLPLHCRIRDEIYTIGKTDISPSLYGLNLYRKRSSPISLRVWEPLKPVHVSSLDLCV